MKKSTKFLIIIAGIIMVCTILVVMYNTFDNNQKNSGNNKVYSEQIIYMPF